ncbi:MAG: DUF4097 family beta strand repeat protein [Candidatus Omnitrophica bacterium]|nr:DUF4097 family beta strand repeat protein [Candidatus Omnitrophota bacterium]
MKKNYTILPSFLCAILCIYLCGCNLAGWDLKAKYEEEKDWSLSAAEVELIDVVTTNGAIIVSSTDAPEIKIHAVKTIRAKTEEKAKEYAGEVVLYVEQDEGALNVFHEHPSGWKQVQVGVSYTISCPPQMEAKLKSTNGKISIDRLQRAVDALTTNGSIHLTGGQGEIQLRTTNGSVDIADSSGRINASTTNGKISARQIALSERADFSTTNGGVELDIESGAAPITAVSTNGSITLSLPAQFSGQLDASVSNGRIASDFAVPGASSQKKSLRGSIGEGGENRIFLTTTNGNISLKKRQTN